MQITAVETLRGRMITLPPELEAATCKGESAFVHVGGALDDRDLKEKHGKEPVRPQNYLEKCSFEGLQVRLAVSC